MAEIRDDQEYKRRQQTNPHSWSAVQAFVEMFDTGAVRDLLSGEHGPFGKNVGNKVEDFFRQRQLGSLIRVHFMELLKYRAKKPMPADV